MFSGLNRIRTDLNAWINESECAILGTDCVSSFPCNNYTLLNPRLINTTKYFTRDANNTVHG